MWLPPLDWRKSDEFVLILELFKEDPEEADADDDSNRLNLNFGNPYAESAAEENVFKKEFTDSNNNGVIIFEISQDKIKSEELKKMRIKVINIDYESSRYSDTANIVRQYFEHLLLFLVHLYDAEVIRVASDGRVSSLHQRTVRYEGDTLLSLLKCHHQTCHDHCQHHHSYKTSHHCIQ